MLKRCLIRESIIDTVKHIVYRMEIRIGKEQNLEKMLVEAEKTECKFGEKQTEEKK